LGEVAISVVCSTLGTLPDLSRKNLGTQALESVTEFQQERQAAFCLKPSLPRNRMF